MVVSVAEPSVIHWTHTRDRKFLDYQQVALDALAAKKNPKGGNPAPPPKGKGEEAEPSSPGGGGNPPTANTGGVEVSLQGTQGRTQRPSPFHY